MKENKLATKVKVRKPKGGKMTPECTPKSLEYKIIAKIEATVGTIIPTITVHTSVANLSASGLIGTDIIVASSVMVSVLRSGMSRTVPTVNSLPVSLVGTGSNVPTVHIAAVGHGHLRQAVSSVAPTEGSTPTASLSINACEVTPNVTLSMSKKGALAGTGSPTVPTGSQNLGSRADLVMSAGTTSPLENPYIVGTRVSSISTGSPPIVAPHICKTKGVTSHGTSSIRTSGTSRQAIGSHALMLDVGPHLSPLSRGTIDPLKSGSIPGQRPNADPSVAGTANPTAATPLPSPADTPDMSGMSTGAVIKVKTSDKDGKSLGTKLVSSVDLTVILVGVTSGILIIIIPAELVLGAVAGGCIGSIVSAIGTSPSALMSPVLTPIVTLLPVMVLVSTTAGPSTAGMAIETSPDSDNSIELTLVHSVTTVTLSPHSTLEGTLSGATLHASSNSVIGKGKKAVLSTHASVASPASKHTPSQQLHRKQVKGLSRGLPHR